MEMLLELTVKATGDVAGKNPLGGKKTHYINALRKEPRNLSPDFHTPNVLLVKVTAGMLLL